MDQAVESLSIFQPIIQTWFKETYAYPTEAQAKGWPAIASGQSTLIAAPTGSGKTLAAFLACIDRLISRGDTPLSHVDTIYVSPLKALSNDVRKNLEKPLAEISRRALAEGIALPPVTVATRTGDTPASERQKMIRKPPHILVTTPESLYILLTAAKSRTILSHVKTVIVDEIHAIADDKRGAHLALTLERLERACTGAGNLPPCRIGLSATQNPIELVARLLVGSDRPMPLIIDSGHRRPLDLKIEITDDELGALASNEQSERIYERMAELIREHETTIVFVNTRRMAERLSHALEERLGEDQVVAHHGSLSKRIRLASEEKLKAGKVRCAVATASLELGIDVGSVDLVIQFGSTRAISTFLQRVGRSGHTIGALPKGRIFANTRDELIEATALIRAIHEGRLDALVLPAGPLDVLAQQIVAEVAATEEVSEEQIFQDFRRAIHYKDLERSRFDAIIAMLSEGTSPIRGRAKAHLHRDRIAGVVKPRRGARLAAITCGGSIPDTFTYPVFTYPEDSPVGSLDEEFALETPPGSVFLLGNTSWRIRRVEALRVIVEDARGEPPNIPFWFGESPARSKELSAEVASLRADVEVRLLEGQSLEAIAEWICGLAAMPTHAALGLARYLDDSRRILGALPTQKTVIAERFFDEAGGMQLVIHSPFGARINKAWGLALRKKFCRSFNLELQAAATDDGIVISLGPPHSFELASVFEFVKSHLAKKVLTQATLGAPVFGVRWRWAVCRALAVLRNNAGKRVPPQILRMRTEDLLSTVFPMQQACLENVVGDIEVPDHPLVFEAMRDCLSEFMDVEGLVDLLRGIEDKSIQIVARDTAEPSPLCHELLVANPYAFLDDAPAEERRTRAVYVPRGARTKDEQNLCGLSAKAIAEVEGAARPSIRSADDLHDLLLSLYVVPADSPWSTQMKALIAAGRASTFVRLDREFWVAAERAPLVQVIWPELALRPTLDELPFQVELLPRESVIKVLIRGHLELKGPVCASDVSEWLSLDIADVQEGVGGLEADGAILRGQFSERAKSEQRAEICDRRMLQRIHRNTLGTLRRSVEPVSAQVLMRFIFRWQRVGQSTKLIGHEGLLEIIEQLQGFEAAAGAWERDILPARLHHYEASWMDALCFAGQVSWARLSPKENSGTARNEPSKSAPLTFMLRRDQAWLRASASQSSMETLSENAKAVFQALDDRGAVFLDDLVNLAGLSAQDIQAALWELVGVGLATADGFSSMRLLIEKRGVLRSAFDSAASFGAISSHRWRQTLNRARRADRKRPAHAGKSLTSAAGRWSKLLPPDPLAMDPDQHARLLLKRYGIIFRDLLARESALPPWREVLIALRRMEARGEIRGGRFVRGFAGEQFALPEAVDGLRSLRDSAERGVERVTITATDPLNLVGITSPGPKVPAVMGNKILYVDGVPVASLESNTVTTRNELPEGAKVGPKLQYTPPAKAGSEQISLGLKVPSVQNALSFLNKP